MKITISYSSDTLLPKEIEKAIDKTKKRIHECRNEADKVELILENLKSEWILWIYDNRIKMKEDYKEC
jgi:hypothetical protein